ncbi:STAS domain-containing protein [Longispora urticae]
MPAPAGANTDAATVITTKSAGDGVLIAVHGEVDLGCHDTLFTVLHDAITAGRIHLTVDLSGTTFLDSGGIGVLIAGRNAANAAQGTLTVTGATGLVARILKMTGVWDTLTTPRRLS